MKKKWTRYYQCICNQGPNQGWGRTTGRFTTRRRKELKKYLLSVIREDVKHIILVIELRTIEKYTLKGVL